MRRHAKPLALLVLLAALGTAALLFPVGDWLTTGLAWIDANRRIAWALYAAAYVGAAVLLVPGSILTLAAGFLFGLPLGVGLVSVSSVVGAGAAFLVGRFLARDWVRERVASLPSFRALDHATHNEGFMIVLLARLSPLLPYNLLNYAFGITAVRLRHYLLGTWLGMLPATVVYVYIGTLAGDLATLGAGWTEGSFATRALFIGGLIATVVLTVLITRKAGRALAAHLAPKAESKGP
jgi:uncharacterized membrane protein YdjX (TVP38/TMEM64 family)